MTEIAQLIVGVPERNADLFYATKFSAPDAFTFLAAGGKKIVVMSELEFERAKKEAMVDEVVLAVDLAKKPGYEGDSSDGPSHPYVMRRLLREYDVRAVRVPFDFPVRAADILRARGVTIVYDPLGTSVPFFPARAIKTAEEIAAIEETQRNVEEVFLMARSEIEKASVRNDGILLRNDGAALTVEYLRGMMNAEFARRGCTSKELIIAVGDQAVDPHELGSGPLKAYTWIVFDIFPKGPKWYFADMSRTVSKGEPPVEAQKIYQKVLAQQKRGIEMIREGVDGFEIHKAIVEAFQEGGFPTGKIDGIIQGFFHGIGHGVGLEIHEPPSISKAHDELRAGHIVTVEPGLYYLGRGCVRIEDMVLVTPDGCRNLTNMSKSLLWAMIP